MSVIIPARPGDRESERSLTHPAKDTSLLAAISSPVSAATSSVSWRQARTRSVPARWPSASPTRYPRASRPPSASPPGTGPKGPRTWYDEPTRSCTETSGATGAAPGPGRHDGLAGGPTQAEPGCKGRVRMGADRGDAPPAGTGVRRGRCRGARGVGRAERSTTAYGACRCERRSTSSTRHCSKLPDRWGVPPRTASRSCCTSSVMYHLRKRR